MASRIGKKEWTILIVIAATLDFIQFVVIEMILGPAFGIGVGINEVLDRVIGIGSVVYLTIRGVNLIKYPSRIASMLGMQAVEALTGGVAQLWFLEMLYLRRSVRLEDEAAEQAEMPVGGRVPLYANGTRTPSGPSVNPVRNPNLAPKYIDGVRAPGK